MANIVNKVSDGDRDDKVDIDIESTRFELEPERELLFSNTAGSTDKKKNTRTDKTLFNSLHNLEFKKSTRDSTRASASTTRQLFPSKPSSESENIKIIDTFDDIDRKEVFEVVNLHALEVEIEASEDKILKKDIDSGKGARQKVKQRLSLSRNPLESTFKTEDKSSTKMVKKRRQYES